MFGFCNTRQVRVDQWALGEFGKKSDSPKNDRDLLTGIRGPEEVKSFEVVQKMLGD